MDDERIVADDSAPKLIAHCVGEEVVEIHLDDDLTGTENLVLIGRLLDLRARESKRRAAELLAEFDLTEAADRPAKTYSGGMRRRLDLAASLVGRPTVIFLDEPTTGLDPTKRDEVWMTVRGLVAQGATVLLTTQYLDEADALADEISVFDHGRIIAHGTPHELKQIVGDQSLQVRPVDETRMPDVARVLTAVAGTAPESPRRGVLQVPVRGDEALTETVALLSAEGIAVTELALKLPGLDEVFAALTGAPATSDDDEEAA